MAETAAHGFAATPCRRESDGIDETSTGAAAVFDGLRSRLRAAQDRALSAERRRQQLFAEAQETVQSRTDDVCRLEHSIADLESRARAYSRALNEAASLVEDMDRRIARAEDRLAAIRSLLAVASPRVVNDLCEDASTEDVVARDLDLMRGGGTWNDGTTLRTRLGLILAA